MVSVKENGGGQAIGQAERNGLWPSVVQRVRATNMIARFTRWVSAAALAILVPSIGAILWRHHRDTVARIEHARRLRVEGPVSPQHALPVYIRDQVTG